MRKHALAGSLAIHASALLLLLLLGAIARNSIAPPPAVILFGPPLRAPRLPEVHVEGGGGQQAPLPARRGRAPLPAKRRVFLPPMLATNARPDLVAPEAFASPPVSVCRQGLSILAEVGRVSLVDSVQVSTAGLGTAMARG